MCVEIRPFPEPITRCHAALALATKSRERRSTAEMSWTCPAGKNGLIFHDFGQRAFLVPAEFERRFPGAVVRTVGFRGNNGGAELGQLLHQQLLLGSEHDDGRWQNEYARANSRSKDTLGWSGKGPHGFSRGYTRR